MNDVAWFVAGVIAGLAGAIVIVSLILAQATIAWKRGEQP